MGRPKKPNGYRHMIGTRLNDEQILHVEALAEELKISRGEALREIVNYAIQTDPRKVKEMLDNKANSKPNSPLHL